MYPQQTHAARIAQEISINSSRLTIMREPSFLMSAAFKIAEKLTFEFESLHPLSG